MSQVKKLTRLGSDTRKIAALLQAKAPKGEMLAYISPQEAALLKSRGGSGMPHADTGIPSYQIMSDFSEPYMYESYTTPVNMGGGDFAAATPSAYDLSPGLPSSSMEYLRQQFPGAPISAQFEPPAPPPTVDFGGVAPVSAAAQGVPTPSMPAFMPPAVEGYQLGQMDTGRVGQEPSALSRLGGALGIDKLDPTRLGIAGLQALIGGRQARAATRQGQAGKQEMQALAAPYRQQGQQIQAQAARGELTPQAQQSLQAVQAQLAQGAQARGGVGAAQIAGQVEAVRQQLLQSQADYGLKLSGIGDQIALGAIRAGIQADQYVNNLTSSYMNNIMRVFGGTAPAAPGGQR